MRGTYKMLNKTRESINKFQENDFVHSLTCGNDSLHEDLVPQLKPVDQDKDEYELLLTCKECDWIQDVPPFFTLKATEDETL